MTRDPEVYVKPWVMTELARKAPQLPPTGDSEVVVWGGGGQWSRSEVTAYNLIPPKLSKRADCSFFVSL